MKQRIALFVFLLPVVAWLSACGGNGGGFNPSPTPKPTEPLAVAVSAASSTVAPSGTDALTATVTGGSGGNTVSWSAVTGTFSPETGLTTAYNAPAKEPSPDTVTLTAKATDSKGDTATGTVKVTVKRLITISLPQPIPNNEIYSDFGMLLAVTINCTGCQSGDVLNVKGQNGYGYTDPYQDVPWVEALNSTGFTYQPGPIKIWASGTDGAKSNALWLTFDGSENMAVQDPSSGEIYYAYSGNGTQGSFSTLKFKQDGTADGNFQDGGFGIAVDNTTHDVVTTAEGGVGIYFSNGTVYGGVSIPNSNSTAYALAVSAANGLGCATQPTIDSVSCLDLPASIFGTPQPFTLPGLPSGSQPTPIKVIDPSHIVVYGRGDQTLRWYTISGTTAAASGTLQLSEFTPADANYWKTYPATGGWDLAQVGSTLGVMGQVVNGDGTVSQKLALVNNTNQTLIQYVDLPNGTVHIAADPTNNAIVAGYVDFTVSPPATRFERIYVDTGNTVLLQSTSNLVPGAGFLVTNDGSHIAVFVEGKADFELNQ